MNGAVQGDATATASTPVKKLSATGWRACRLATEDGSMFPNSNTPGQVQPDEGEQPGQRRHHGG
jgi:hypothetical protein